MLKRSLSEGKGVVVFAEEIVAGGEPRHDCIQVVVVGSCGLWDLQAVVEAGVYQMGFDSTWAKMTVAISLEVEDRTAVVVEEEEEEMVHQDPSSMMVEDEAGEADQTCLHRVC